ncbi:MAG: histidine phosphatase family protein [bacterium]|nr:histidine phosphatase family protein [bacterium]
MKNNSAPNHLVLVRHGQSEANVIQKAVKNGVLSEYPGELSQTPDREIRLSKLGREQAEATGPWLNRNYPDRFDAIFVSDHVRAKETSALLCLSAGWSNCKIFVDPLLGERSWGRFGEADSHTRDRIMLERKRDPLHAAMPDGETLLATRHRSRVLLDIIYREFSEKNVLVFSHGEYIEALWAEIEHMTSERQREFFNGPHGHIRNCQIVEFSSVNPHTKSSDGRIRWVRSSCPHIEEFGHWKPASPVKFSPDDLLKQVDSYKHLDIDGIDDQ